MTALGSLIVYYRGSVDVWAPESVSFAANCLAKASVHGETS